MGTIAWALFYGICAFIILMLIPAILSKTYSYLKEMKHKKIANVKMERRNQYKKQF